ncbi:Pre-mRNA-splicing factor 38 [Perkinsela sp. CCAP 1560/4]|nr:Pre-mRNA-splicing factor 38 [Perkinsela sp. CCAP 1560/4]|eukprot:KNH08740.1 Pre-mRNA-splicing factor 38 [Perkinsela sp. CCAP 1560/4]
MIQQTDKACGAHGLAKNMKRKRSWRCEKLLRSDIYELIESSSLWTEIANVNTVRLISMAIDRLKVVEGTRFSGKSREASTFQVLLAKLLELKLPTSVITAMLCQPYFKYITLLSAVVIRLTQPHWVIWQLLGPLLNDYRNLIIRVPPCPSNSIESSGHESFLLDNLIMTLDGQQTYALLNMDVLIFDLLHLTGHYRILDIHLPHISITPSNLKY